jgi:hypothetical protein
MATQATMGDLELGLLRTFVSVIHHGSVGKAAVAIEMTQSAVSQRMLRLEKIVATNSLIAAEMVYPSQFTVRC